MSEINNDQNNQVYPIKCDAEGAKFSQVSDIKLSFEGTNRLSILALQFGFWLSNKFLSRRYADESTQIFKSIWEDVSQEFQNLNKANPFACFWFACRMAHSFDKASSGRISIAVNDTPPAEGENIPKFKQNQTNEVSKTNDPSSQKHNEGLGIHDYLSANNALPPKAPCFFDCKVFSSFLPLQETNMRIDQNCEIKINLKNPDDGYDRRLVPTRNVIFSEIKHPPAFVTITGEYCDVFDNNTWKQFSYRADKKNVFFWKSVNSLLAILAQDGTIDLSELIKDIRGFSDSENVISATTQGETDGGETKLKIDNFRDEVSLSKIDGEKKIPLNNPVISKGADSEHVIISAQDDEGQQRSFVIKLSDLISNEKWEPFGTFAKKIGELTLLSRFLDTQFDESLRGKKKEISFDPFEKGKIFEQPYAKLIVTGEGKFSVFYAVGLKLNYSDEKSVYIQKKSDANGHVSIYAIGDQESVCFTVRLADLLSKDGWVEQKK